MGRRLRCDLGGYVYHVLNRGAGRGVIFHKDGDYAAFESVLDEAAAEVPMRLLAYCLMPNHWHLVVWPSGDGDLSRYMHWVTLTHTRRWHEHYHKTGTGPLYQGRYKSFPVQEDDHFFSLCRYVERNPLRAGLVRRAENWPWSSLFRRTQSLPAPRLSIWPLAPPADWPERVNRVETAAELERIRQSVRRGSPFGGEDWCAQTAKALGLESTLRPRGRPKREKGSGSFSDFRT
jgi:putative transposase